MKKISNAIQWFNLKKMTFVVNLVFIVSMLPNWYLAFFARPSGDDYGYAAASRQAWVNTHSFIEVVKAGLKTTRDMCEIWNGDWFSVFVFTFMPEVFIDKSFWIVPIFWSLAMIFATVYAANELLVHRIGIERQGAIIAAAGLLVLGYQWIPSSAIGLYWYVGVIHYIMPYVISLLEIGFLSKYFRTGKCRYLAFSALGMIAIGGSSYYSSFLILLLYVLVFIYCGFTRNKKALFLGIPFLTGGIALYLQVTAPGNVGRVGEGLKFSIDRVIDTIIEALLRGITTIKEYFMEIPLIFAIIGLLAILLWECMVKADLKVAFSYPLLWIGYMYGIFASMFTPEIYADTDISGGPPTMEYLTFLLMIMAIIIYVEGWLIGKLKKAGKLKESHWYHTYVTMGAILIYGILLVVFRGDLRESLFWESCEYIASGSADDYKTQMDSQLEILLDDTIKEAYLCPTNDYQGPLMHMPVIKDPEAFTNQVVAEFYGKDFVIAME